MSSKLTPNENIKLLIDKIIAKNGLRRVKNVEYLNGAQVGDGYLSKTVAVEIIHEDGTLSLFIKYPQDIESSESFPLDKLYHNEIYFYDIVYPAFLEFLRNRHAEGVFHHVPICYGTSQKGGIVALEDLKKKGLSMWNRKASMDRHHIELVLRTFARFHAVSFAFKDQRREKYKELIDNSHADLLSKILEWEGVRAPTIVSVEKLLKYLDPVEDRRVLDKCANLVEEMLDSMTSVRRCKEDYSILTQGDCWCNNMMFLYSKENCKKPEDVVLIDWQLFRQAPPVFDISYFYYTIASEEALDHLDGYLKVYHRELTERIRELGSDPDVLYPFRVLREQWKRYARYGVAMAFTLIRMMLSSGNEIVSLDGEDTLMMNPKIKREEEFLRRMKILLEHLVDNDFL